MWRMKAILVASVMAVSLLAAAGSASARSDMIQCGTAWTEVDDVTASDPIGVSWELWAFAY
jgi:ABC-type proline/glycine betaine transport system substrate-binding protein